MFGTLRAHTCGLGCQRAREYDTFYCGLCKSLGDHFGTLTRAMLNYDAVFLALVADGLMEEKAAPDRCRCPILPVTFRPTVRPDSPAMRYAAAMQMLLSDQWLADRAADDAPVAHVARAARPLLSGKVEVARTILADLGISLADLEGFEERQARCEIAGVTSPREAAEPTASALELVFERMVLLPGVTADARTPDARAALGALGRHLGSAIYLIDALEDVEKDHEAGAFNPCLRRGRRGDGRRVSWARIEAALELLRDDLDALDRLARALPLMRHRELVLQVVSMELQRKAHAAAKTAHAYARADAERARAPRRVRPWPVRALSAVAAAFVFAWVWLASFAALARPPGKPHRDAHSADAGRVDADAGCAPDAGDAGDAGCPDAGRAPADLVPAELPFYFRDAGPPAWDARDARDGASSETADAGGPPPSPTEPPSDGGRRCGVCDRCLPGSNSSGADGGEPRARDDATAKPGSGNEPPPTTGGGKRPSTTPGHDSPPSTTPGGKPAPAPGGGGGGSRDPWKPCKDLFDGGACCKCKEACSSCDACKGCGCADCCKCCNKGGGCGDCSNVCGGCCH